MTRSSITEARARLAEVLDRVSAGEEITITRHGVDAAVVVRPGGARGGAATIERSREIGALLDAARTRPLPGAVLSAERAEDVVQAVRADRDRWAGIDADGGPSR